MHSFTGITESAVKEGFMNHNKYKELQDLVDNYLDSGLSARSTLKPVWMQAISAQQKP